MANVQPMSTQIINAQCAQIIISLLKCEVWDLQSYMVIPQKLSSYSQAVGHYIADAPELFVKISPHLVQAQDGWREPRKPLRDSVDIEILILCAIRREIIKRRVCPHFCEIFAFALHNNIDAHIADATFCKLNSLTVTMHRPVARAAICNARDLREGGLASDYVTISIMENCGQPLSEYIGAKLARDSDTSTVLPSLDRELMGIVFQIYYSLLVARRTWSTFRHGDLLLKNIMLARYDLGVDSEHGCNYFQYVVDGREYNVPLLGAYIVKIIDFSHGEIREIGAISAITMPMRNTWVSDHVLFVADLTSILYQHLELVDYTAMMKKINPMRLMSNRSRGTILTYSDHIVDPESAFARDDIFAPFTTPIETNKIVRKYIAPACTISQNRKSKSSSKPGRKT